MPCQLCLAASFFYFVMIGVHFSNDILLTESLLVVAECHLLVNLPSYQFPFLSKDFFSLSKYFFVLLRCVFSFITLCVFLYCNTTSFK